MVKRYGKKRSFKKSSRRRSFKKRRRSIVKKAPALYTARKFISNSTSLQPFPNGKIMKMPYHDFSSHISTSGLHSYSSWLLTSIYDPLFAGSGRNAQPYGHDEMVPFYARYVVLGAKVVSTFRWSTSSATRPVACYALLDDDSTLPTILQTKQERYGPKVQILKADSTSSVSITNFYSAAKWHKMSKNALSADHQLTAQLGASPTNKPVYLHAGIQTADSANTSNTVDIYTKIIYVVKLMDPKPILGS